MSDSALYNKVSKLLKPARGKRGTKSSFPSFLAVDFFSGAGGTTRGLIDAGGYVIAGVDKDSSCQKTYTTNNKNLHLDQGNARFLNRDIFPKDSQYPEGEQETLLNELEALITEYKNITPSSTPLFFAICAPCQPFTKLSQKETQTKERQTKRKKDQNLLHEAGKFVKHLKPEIVLSENVAGISSQKFGSVWTEFKKELESLGYVTATKIVCASNFGVPQKRRRSILLAIKKEFLKDTDIFLEVPESDPDARTISVREAIGHLPPIKAGEKHKSIPNHKTQHLNDLNYKRISVAPPGESNLYLESTIYGDLSLDCHKRAKEKHGVGCFSDVYTRMHPDKPSPTITTRCYSVSNGRYGHYDPSQVRAISLREAAALQSFPDNYVFCDSDSVTTVGRMIGNAVPPKLAEFYARYLVETASLLGTK